MYALQLEKAMVLLAEVEISHLLLVMLLELKLKLLVGTLTYVVVLEHEVDQ